MVARSLLIFAIHYALLILLIGTSIFMANPLLKAFAGLFTGLVIGQLFVIGHDACHGSLCANRRMNRVIGTLAFLPTLTPFSTWAVGHNQVHHVYTNLKSRDYVWVPYSKAEYDALPAWRRVMERLYRTPFGHGLNYFVEIWWTRLFFPRRANIVRRSRVHLLDSLLVTVAACGVAAIVTTSAYMLGQNVILAIVCTMVVPFIEFNIIIGFLIFQHHTSPDIRWYADEAQWKTTQAQIDAVQHIVFPGILNLLFQNIMEHHAHHLDPSLSLHQLRPAQAALEASLGPGIRVVHWTPKRFAETARVCKLYDYGTHRWCDFDGNYTTKPVPAAL
jgi:omega-6 fatty acid desaturase (delta-12 desaturase)